MASKNIPAASPPDRAPLGLTEPKLSVSFFGFKVDGSGATGVRFAFWIVLALCGLAGVNTLAHLRF